MACPFCKKVEYTGTVYPLHGFNGKEFRYVKCRGCRLVYLTPMPDESDYEAMYPPSYQSNEADTSILADQYRKMPGLRFSYGYQYDLIRKFTGPGALILDYGCGTGHFIANAMQNGFKCAGAEFNPDYVAILKKGISGASFYLIGDLLEQKSGQQFDVIRLSNVLEHLADPVAVITRLKTYLRPGGLLLVEGPVEANFSLARNFRCFYFRIKKLIKGKWLLPDPPYHIFFSDRKNQQQFFADCGLKQVHFEVKEDAWPFPPTLAQAKGFTQKLNAIVAKISMATSRFFRRSAGNTFIYAGQ